MRSLATVWLIQRGPASAPIAEFAHDVAPSAFEWSSGRNRARRFKSKADAERFGANLLASSFHASEHALRDLVREADARTLVGEVEDLGAFSHHPLI